MSDFVEAPIRDLRQDTGIVFLHMLADTCQTGRVRPQPGKRNGAKGKGLRQDIEPPAVGRCRACPARATVVEV